MIMTPMQETARQAAELADFEGIDIPAVVPTYHINRIADAVAKAVLLAIKRESVPVKSLSGRWADVVPCDHIDVVLAEYENTRPQRDCGCMIDHQRAKAPWSCGCRCHTRRDWDQDADR